MRDRVVIYLHRRDPARRAELLNLPGKALSPMSPSAARALAKRLRKAERSSRFHGVCRDDRAELARPWCVKLTVGGLRKQGVLRYRTEREAAIAHDRAALHYLGRSARLNFPRLAAELQPADLPTLRAECLRDRKATTRSRFVGVNPRPSGRWYAMIAHRRRRFYIGTFDTEEEAALAYDAAARRMTRTRLRLNFHPVTGEELCGQWFDP